MKISVMREFIRLAANKNYTKTAEELFMAQSALSRHMSSMEEELGCKLIKRDRNAFELTPKGELALSEFQKVLDDYEKMLDKLARMDSIEGGELRLGYLYYDSDYYVAKIREVFHQKHPTVKLTLLPYQPMQLEKDLLEGKLDAALLYGIEGSQRSDIEYLPFLNIPFTMFYSINHRFRSLKDISAADIDGEILLVPEKPFMLNRVSEQWEKILQYGGAIPGGRVPIDNYDEIPWILEETGGIYCSPMANPNPYGKKVEQRLLMPELYHSDVSAVWLKSLDNPAIQLLKNVIRICYP